MESLSWKTRCAAWLLIWLQILPPPLLLAVAADSAPPAAQTSATAAPRVTVNRTVPVVAPPSSVLSFSASPTTGEITRAQVFAEPLIAAGEVTAVENAALAAALTSYAGRTDREDLAVLTGFLAAHPQSPWRASLWLSLGHLYYHGGWFSKALDAWEQAWLQSKQETAPALRAVADQAAGELARMNARLGRAERLETLFAELQGRTITGSATELLTGAREGLWLMRNKPEDAFRCGPMALGRILATQHPSAALFEKIHTSRSTPSGMSLSAVKELADTLGLSLQMAVKEPAAPMLLPAVVHWRVGHYAAIIKEHAGRYLIEDPTFHDNLWISRAALDAEASGYYLVPAGTLPAGWQPVSVPEGGQVWGKGNTTGNDKDRDTPCDDKAKKGGCGAGMAEYNMHTMLVSLNITDTPLFYDTPLGGGIAFSVTYNQREANQPATFSSSNFGQKWSCNWMSWIADDPSLPSADATLIVAGGGARVFQSFNAGTQSYAPDAATKAVLVRTSATSYEQRFSDGSKEVFSTATAVTGAGRKVFLTQRVDATGNAVGLTYDSTYRLAGVTDTLGQVSTFSYEQAGDPLKIAKITDTFGRTAQFAYNGAGYLQQITDMIGLTSQFTYTGSFINALTTPYGTTTFAYGEVGAGTSSIRWLEATDPLGGKERLEYRHNAPGIAASDPAGTVPDGISLTNAYLNYRNSFFWDKKAMMDAPGDYTKAKITHWLHTSDGNAAAGVKESEKSPLENRVWYSYPYQPNSYYIGSDERPFARAQALSDGTTQVAYWQYNALGNLTKSTDPIGRVTDYLYDPAGLDLVEVRNHTGNLYELLASFTYTDALHLVSIHQPLTRTDAAGQVTGYNYNARGQKLTETVTRNGQPETTTWNYDAGGYLQNITGPLAGATVGFTYDGYGRMQTVTDSENYTATSTYDGLNRPLKTTYPDGTFEQTIYNKLDAEWQRDRLGRWSRAEHDELQRTSATTDPAGRKVQYDWCVCGALHKLIDAAGQTTEFEYDIQRRPTKRTFADGTFIRYFYDPAHALLSAVLDAKGQKTHYTYKKDDRLATITYTDALDQPLTPPTPGVSYEYGNNYPHLKEFTDGTGTTTLDYYNVHSGTLGAGRLQAVNGPLTGKVDKITYTYDELGRVTGRTLNTTAESITLDALGRATAATNALGSFLTGYVNATARPQTVTYPNGQTTTYSYHPNTAPAETGNGDQRLQTIWHQDAAAATISKHDYSYNPGGEITGWTQQAGPAPATAYGYEYDRASQLLAATRKDAATNAVQKQYTYRYDLAGNRTLEQIDNAVSSATYNSVNQLTARTGAGPMVFEGTVNKDATVTVGGIAATVNAQNRFTAQVYVQPGQQSIEITARDTQGRQTAGHAQMTVEAGAIIPLVFYDLNGNQTADGARTYDWDAANRLVKITQGTNVREFTYNGFGQRMSEKVNSTLTRRWLWDGTEMIAELDANNAVTKRFFAQGEQLAGAPYYYTRDHLGSIREVTDTTNTLRARYDYDPWGRRSANLVTTNPVESDFGYTGHYYDAPTGMHVTLCRWLESGRWLSRDPIWEDGGMNLYGYVENQPIDLTDVLGLAPPGQSLPTFFQAAFPGHAQAAAAMRGDSCPSLTGNFNRDVAYSHGLQGVLVLPTVAAGTQLGATAAGVVAVDAGVAEGATAAARAAKEAAKKVKIDGPKPNKDGVTGRICQLRYGNTPLLRLDYHAIPGSGGEPRLHLNIGPGQGKNSIHIPIPIDSWPPPMW